MSQKALKNLDRFVKQADTVNVLMAADAKNQANGVPFEVQRLDMSKELAKRFRNDVRECLTSKVEDMRVMPYNTQYSLGRQELFGLNLNDDSDTKDTLDFIESVTQPGVFEKDDDFAGRMAFYTIVVEKADDKKNSKKRAAFYRKHSPKNQLSRGIIAQIVDQNHFEELKTKAYLFDEKIDFFTWNNHLYIRNSYNFRLIFDHFAELKQEVKANVKQVTSTVPIQNEKEFLKACRNQPQMVSKVASVADQPYLSDVEMKDIHRTINEFDLDLEIVTEDGEEKLVFDSSIEQRWTILKMLDDDYLGSVMTERKYETNSKIVRST